MNVFEIILCVVGAWQIIMSFISNTKNVGSAIIYKVIPFASGEFCIFFALYNSGIVRIG
ncbi:hypothetical protein [Agathobacter rectalis]|jgi:hypothetical protein|uniref:hypothetical protein n=1 Tax=Agathobacter rectalis TaxID=39491 RepID=UPI0026C2602B|nr:hypothetical protein [Agathobacter rectalis]